MPYARPLFGTFALLYCLCLGAFSLYKNRHSEVHRLFALFCFSLAFFNAGDYAVFLPNHAMGLWWVRITGLGSVFTIYYFLRFTYALSGFSQTRSGKRIMTGTRGAAVTFTLLYLTPLIIRDMNFLNAGSVGLEIPGPLYPLFMVYAIGGLMVAVVPLYFQLKTSTEWQRKIIHYVFWACAAGTSAISFYFLSAFWKDLPWIYYPLEALVCFIFSYAIFQHNLIPVSVGLRRALLAVGIYITLAMILVPVTLLYHETLTHGGPAPLLLWMSASGILFSLGPIVYAAAVRRISLFQDQTISHITHEFKTPLHAIQSAKTILEEEMAKKTPDPARLRDYLQMIERNSGRLENFVVDILHYSKAEAPEPGQAKTRLNLTQLCMEVAAQFPEARRRIRIEGETEIQVTAVEEGVRQIFLNLISNALKSAPAGEIRIHIKKNHGAAEVAVTDHGRGIAKENLSRIFSPFVQANKERADQKGTGLGLAIAKRWVEAHGGRIWAESDGEGLPGGGQGKGATFRFTLPVG